MANSFATLDIIFVTVLIECYQSHVLSSLFIEFSAIHDQHPVNICSREFNRRFATESASSVKMEMKLLDGNLLWQRMGDRFLGKTRYCVDASISYVVGD